MSEGSIVAGWIAPHGVVPDMPADRLERVPNTNRAMAACAARVARLEPEAAILVAPHGFRAADANTVSLCRHNFVNLSTWYSWRDDDLEVDGDPDLAASILEAAHAAERPALGLIYGATTEASYPMDWSITAPMIYLKAAGWNGTLVPVTFSGLPFESEWEFGRTIGQAVKASGRRVAFIASSDLSHVHSNEGPYGCKPIAPEYDRTIETAVRSGDLKPLCDLDPEWVSDAAQDGLRSILIMGGAIEGLGFEPREMAYEVLIYFGMLTAAFLPPGT